MEWGGDQEGVKWVQTVGYDVNFCLSHSVVCIWLEVTDEPFSFVVEKDVQSGMWITGILYLSVVDLCISCWKCYRWCSVVHVCCFFCRADDLIEVSRWVPQKCSVTVNFCGITSYVYMCHSNILFCFQPGRRRNSANQTLEEALAGGQKVHQPLQVAIVSKTSYL